MPAGQLTPIEFVAKWSRVELSERAASQEHFIDLCRMLGQPTPAEHDATGAEYTFEKGVAVTGTASAGSQGERACLLKCVIRIKSVLHGNSSAWRCHRRFRFGIFTVSVCVVDGRRVAIFVGTN